MEKGKNVLTEALDENEKFRPQDFKDKKLEKVLAEQEKSVNEIKEEAEEEAVSPNFNKSFLILIGVAILLIIIFLILSDKVSFFKAKEVPDETESALSSVVMDRFDGVEIDLTEATSLKDDIIDLAVIASNDQVNWLVMDGILYSNTNGVATLYETLEGKTFAKYLKTDYGKYLLANDGSLYLVVDKVITKIFTFNIDTVIDFGSIEDGLYIYIITSENKMASAYYKNLTNWNFITLSKATLNNVKYFDFICNDLSCLEKMGMLINGDTVLFMDNTNRAIKILSEVAVTSGYNVKDIYHQYIWLKDGRLLFANYNTEELIEVSLYDENVFKMNDNGYFETESGYVLNSKYDYSLYENTIEKMGLITEAKVTVFGEGYVVAGEELYIGSDVYEKASFEGHIDNVITSFNTNDVYIISGDKVFVQVNNGIIFEELDGVDLDNIKYALEVSKVYPINEEEVLFFNNNGNLNIMGDNTFVSSYADDYSYLIDNSGGVVVSSSEDFVVDLNMLGRKIDAEEAILEFYSFKGDSVYAIGGSYLDRNLINTMRSNYYIVVTKTKVYLYDENFSMEKLLMENYKSVVMEEGALYLRDADGKLYTMGYNYNRQLFRNTADDNNDGIMDFSNELIFVLE